MCPSIVRRSPRQFDRSVLTKSDSKFGEKNAWTLTAAPKNSDKSVEL